MQIAKGFGRARLPRGATLVSKAAEALEKTRFMESERNLISGNLLI